LPTTPNRPGELMRDLPRRKRADMRAIGPWRDPQHRCRVPCREPGAGFVARCEHATANELRTYEHDRDRRVDRRPVKPVVADRDLAGQQSPRHAEPGRVEPT